MDQNDKINFQHLSKFIEEGDVLVDIGANAGIYTQYFNEVTKGNSKIYSVELHPTTYNNLVNRFSGNKNIIVKNYAVSDTNEMVDFYLGRDSFTNNIIGHDMNFKENQVGGKVQGITVDELLKDEKDIKLIKIDVEGAENLVLKGMEETIEKVDYIFVECHLNEGWEEIRDLLLNKYKLSCSSIEGGEIIESNSGRIYQCFCKTNRDDKNNT
jgi:FkbM family methyltransferase